jgi:hypothetical protein
VGEAFWGVVKADDGDITANNGINSSIIMVDRTWLW